MGDKTGIEWTDSTDNVIIALGGGWWCRKVLGDPCCEHCYAEQVNNNAFFGGNHLKYEGEPPKLELRRDLLARWKRQTKARKHFVMSLSDIFGEWIPREWQFDILDAMHEAPLQTFQILTKRTSVAVKSIKLWMAARGLNEAPSNIWFGFTCGTQRWFIQRWSYAQELAKLGFTIFISAEPLFEEIKLSADFLALGPRAQVIVGGESGKHARPMHPDWARSLRDQCVSAGVRFFFKQHGEWIGSDQVMADGTDPVMSDCQTQHRWPQTKPPGPPYFGMNYSLRVGKKAAGHTLDGVLWQEFPNGQSVVRSVRAQV